MPDDEARTRPHDKAPLRLVVIGDSTSFTDHRGPQMPSEPTLYPNVVRALLEDRLERPVELQVIARPGSTVREMHRTLTKDRHVMFEVLMGADAVIVGVGSIDNAPSGIPAAAEALAPFVRPAWLRHRVRRFLRDAHPYGVRLTQGRFTHTPRAELARLYDGVLLQVRALTQGAAGVALGPTSHRSHYYGSGHPTHSDREGLQRDIATRHGFPFVSSWSIVEPHADQLNRDGVHWPSEAHAAVAEALADRLAAQFEGFEPRPPVPTWD